MQQYPTGCVGAELWHKEQQGRAGRQAIQRRQLPLLTQAQRKMLRRVSRLRLANILLILPFLSSLDWWVSGTHYLALPLLPLVLILALMVRNGVVSRKIRKRYSL